MYVPAETALHPGLLLRHRQDLADLVAPWQPPQVAFFASCKAALWGAWRTLGMDAGDRVLAPAYVFHGVLEPGLALGLQHDYYRVLPNLEPDLDDLLARIGQRTRAVLLVHYFGFPGPAAALRRLCDDRGIALVEDCAHAMFGQTGDGPLGSFGDASVFSFKKTMPVPGGGALVLNRSHYRWNERLSAPAVGQTARLVAQRLWNTCETTLGYSLRAKLLSSHDFRRRLARRRHGMQGDFRHRLSALSGMIAGRVDRAKATERRRENYGFLAQGLAASDHLKPIFPQLPPGVVPFCFPAYAKRRDELQDYLLRRGIHARVYWDAAELPPGALEQFPELSKLLDEILILPAHQDVSIAHLRHIVAALLTIR